MVETAIAIGQNAPDDETMELITFHIAGAFLGGGNFRKIRGCTQYPRMLMCIKH